MRKEEILMNKLPKLRLVFGLVLCLLPTLVACGDTTTTTPATTNTQQATTASQATITTTAATTTTLAATSTAAINNTTTSATSTNAVTTSSTTAITSVTTASAATPAVAENPAIKRQDFMVDFGDFQAKAQLTYPASGNGPFPTVILIPGSTAADMDFTLGNPVTNQPLSHIFRDISDNLTTQGFAVVRYNKHYVNGPGEEYTNQQYYTKITLQQLLADADKVYATTIANPKVDPKKIVIYGWSEGSPIATLLTVTHPEIAGLVLQGLVPGSWKDTFMYQDEEVGLGFMRNVVDENKDGLLTIEELNKAYRGNYGGVAKSTISICYEPAGVRSGNYKANPAVDKNGDGNLDINNEVKPYFDNYFANFDKFALQSGLGIYTTDKQLPAIQDTITKYKGPVLILQGQNDANVSPNGAKKIDDLLAGAGSDHKFILYPNLGHSLGPAISTYTDNFAPISQKPLQDLTGWLLQHINR